MNETTFTRQVMKNWQRQRPYMLWYHKIADPTLGQKYTNERAIDVVVCFNGHFIGMEWKLKKDERAFPIKRVRDGQVKTLCDIEVAGGKGFIMIGVYLATGVKYVYAIPISRWNEQVAKTTDRKSIRLEGCFTDCRIDMIRVGQFKHWDFSTVEGLIL